MMRDITKQAEFVINLTLDLSSRIDLKQVERITPALPQDSAF
jgi:hypothetical protein